MLCGFMHENRFQDMQKHTRARAHIHTHAYMHMICEYFLLLVLFETGEPHAALGMKGFKVNSIQQQVSPECLGR